MKLKGKTVVIVGATGDIAFGIAKILATEGANLVLASRKIETLAPLVDELGKIGSGGKQAIQTDASSLPQVENLLLKSLEIFGGVDILVTSVGSWKMIGVETDNSNFESQLEIDIASFLKAVLLPAFIFNKHFREKDGGLIVDISSHAAEGFLPGNLTYAPTKAAVKIFLDNLRAENGEQSKVKILRVISQLVDTPKNRKNIKGFTPEEWETAVQIKDLADCIIKYFGSPNCPHEQFFSSGIVL